MAHWCRNGILAGEKDFFSRWPCRMQVLHYLCTPCGVPAFWLHQTSPRLNNRLVWTRCRRQCVTRSPCPSEAKVTAMAQSHAGWTREMKRIQQYRAMGRWHGQQTQQEVVTHECSYAYTKQIHESCCKKIQETREEPQWMQSDGT